MVGVNVILQNMSNSHVGLDMFSLHVKRSKCQCVTSCVDMWRPSELSIINGGMRHTIRDTILRVPSQR